MLIVVDAEELPFERLVVTVRNCVVESFDDSREENAVREDSCSCEMIF